MAKGIICAKCGEESPANSYHCINCGESLKHEEQISYIALHPYRVCPICKASLDGSESYCKFCGRSLIESPRSFWKTAGTIFGWVILMYVLGFFFATFTTSALAMIIYWGTLLLAIGVAIGRKDKSLLISLLITLPILVIIDFYVVPTLLSP